MSPILRSLLPTCLSPKNECCTRRKRSAKCHFFCLFRNFSSSSVLLVFYLLLPTLIHAPLTLDIFHISILDVQGHSLFIGLLTLFLCSFGWLLLQHIYSLTVPIRFVRIHPKLARCRCRQTLVGYLKNPYRRRSNKRLKIDQNCTSHHLQKWKNSFSVLFSSSSFG